MEMACANLRLVLWRIADLAAGIRVLPGQELVLPCVGCRAEEVERHPCVLVSEMCPFSCLTRKVRS